MTNWAKADLAAGATGIGVDRENNVIRGYVVAQEGLFKTPGRGQFDLKSLKTIMTLMRKSPKGLKSRLAHPTLSDDGIGKFLGRVKDPSLSSVRVKRGEEWTLLHAVRADLYLDASSFDTPNGNLGKYVLDLAESDPDAISSSLVLTKDDEVVLDPKTKKPAIDEQGMPLAPIWRPTALHASDVVDTGDAVDGMLSAGIDIEGLPDEYVRKGAALLDAAFPNATREFLEQRFAAWMTRYLNARFGAVIVGEDDDELAGKGPKQSDISEEARRRRLKLLELLELTS